MHIILGWYCIRSILPLYWFWRHQYSGNCEAGKVAGNIFAQYCHYTRIVDTNVGTVEHGGSTSQEIAA